MARYDSEDECEAACGTLTMLPPEVQERIVRATPSAALPALARTSRAVRGTVAADIEAERQALAALRAEYPLLMGDLFEGSEEYAPRVSSAGQLCELFALPCQRPFGALLARLRHELLVRLAPTPPPPPGGAAEYYEVYAARYLAEEPENASFVARGIPPGSFPSAQRDRILLLPAETVRVTGGALGASSVVYMLDPYEEAVWYRATPDLLLEVVCLMSEPARMDPRIRSAYAIYTVPPPPPLGGATLPLRGRALRSYMTAVEELFGLDDGSLQLVIDDDGVSMYTIAEDSEMLWPYRTHPRVADTLRRRGMPIDGIRVLQPTGAPTIAIQEEEEDVG